MTPDDASVMQRSKSDPQVFAEIFDRHFRTIHRYLARRLGPDRADDLASEVFTIAFKRRGDYRMDRPDALPWLYGIASNLISADLRSHQRRERLLTRVLSEHEPEPLDDVVARTLDARRELHRLDRELAALSEEDRTTLLLYAWEDLSYQEIADALEIPIGTVRSRLNRVRRKFREPAAGQLTNTEHQQITSKREG